MKASGASAKTNREGQEQPRLRYDRSVFRVMLLAGLLLVFSTSLIGILSFRISENAAIKKLKTNDLAITARSMASQVEGRISRAVETSELLASDPAVVDWIAGGESDGALKPLVLDRLREIPALGYTNAFLVSALTGQYWGDKGELVDRMSEDDPDDSWFYHAITSGKRTEVVVDSNGTLKDTFVFVNVAVGPVDKPLAVTGVGMSLRSLSEEFADYKYGRDSHLWMVGSDGTIHLSDDYEQTGMNIGEFLPRQTIEQLDRIGADEQLVLEAQDSGGNRVDMISHPVELTDMRLLAIIPRTETVGYLDAVRLNTALAVVISLLVVVFIFVYVSRKLADPYKRALLMNRELEAKVEVRTRELAERNKEMMDSIAYANRIQQSVLPSDGGLQLSFAEYFTVWNPRDVVGGDFYWVKQVGGIKWVAVGDCTGHGVPGALMTMLSISLLNRIADQDDNTAPSRVLGKLNALLKETLNQLEPDGPLDDGLDLGLCFLKDDEVVYAGAGITLAVGDKIGIELIKGDKKKIGYRRTPLDYVYSDRTFGHEAGRTFYLVSDGIVDQGGAPRGLSLGKTRLADWLHQYRELPLREQKERFERDLANFMDREPQRDDMTVLAFRPDIARGGKER